MFFTFGLPSGLELVEALSEEGSMAPRSRLASACGVRRLSHLSALLILRSRERAKGVRWVNQEVQ